MRNILLLIKLRNALLSCSLKITSFQNAVRFLHMGFIMGNIYFQNTFKKLLINMRLCNAYIYE